MVNGARLRTMTVTYPATPLAFLSWTHPRIFRKVSNLKICDLLLLLQLHHHHHHSHSTHFRRQIDPLFQDGKSILAGTRLATTFPLTFSLYDRPTSFATSKNSSASKPSTSEQATRTQQAGSGGRTFSATHTPPLSDIARFYPTSPWPKMNPSPRFAHR